MWTGPLFIVGSPRSGTKLLRDLVRQHPRIGLPPYETEFLPRMAARDWPDLADSREFTAMYDWVTRFMYFKYQQDDGRRVTADAWYTACERHDVAGVFEALCRIDGDVPFGSAGVWGEKSPNYREHIPLLNRLWPHVRVVHIVRDARDVALSSEKAWGKHVLRNVQRWADEVAACRRDGQALGERYLELRYEDLLSDPERELTRIAAFLGLEFDERMLTLDKTPENLGETVGALKVVPGNTEKWRERMDARTQRESEAVAGALLSELGYARAFPDEPQRRFSRRQMLRWKLLDGVRLFEFRVRDWGLRDAVKYSISQVESTL